MNTYTNDDAYDAGYEAAMQGKPFNPQCSKGWREGWHDGVNDLNARAA